MEYLFTMIQDINWIECIMDVILSLGTTFLGFLLAIKGEAKYAKEKETEDAKQCIKDLKEELLGIVNEQLPAIDLEFQCYIDPIKTPVWDGLITTNKLQLLAKLKRCQEQLNENVDWYKHLFEIYSMIDEFNKWINLYSERFYEAIIILGDEELADRRTNNILYSLYGLKKRLLLNHNEDGENMSSINLSEIINELTLI